MEDSEPMPGVLRQYRLQLQNASTCQGAFVGGLPESLICAGGMRQSMGRQDTMEEGGIMGHLAKQMRMEKMEGMGGGGQEDAGRMGDDIDMMMSMDDELANVDLLQLLAHLLGRVDGVDGSLGRGMMRNGGAWSLGNEDVVPGIGADMEEGRTTEDGDMPGGTTGMTGQNMMVNPCKVSSKFMYDYQFQ